MSDPCRLTQRRTGVAVPLAAYHAFSEEPHHSFGVDLIGRTCELDPQKSGRHGTRHRA
jgi:hypothetical protein